MDERDNRIGFIKQDMMNSYRVLVLHMGRITGESSVTLEWISNKLFTMNVLDTIIEVNAFDGRYECNMVGHGKSLRQMCYGKDKRLNRLIGWLEEDVKDFCNAVNKLNKKDRHELFSI